MSKVINYSATTEHPDPERIKKMFAFATTEQAEDYVKKAEKINEMEENKTMKYEVSVSTNKNSYSSLELVTGDIIADNAIEAVESFWEALRDKAIDNGKRLNFDGNKVYEEDSETGEQDDEYYLRDSAEATLINE